MVGANWWWFVDGNGEVSHGGGGALSRQFWEKIKDSVDVIGHQKSFERNAGINNKGNSALLLLTAGCPSQRGPSMQ